MVDATNTAITAKADGIALAVVDKAAFRAPVDQALDAGHPGRLVQRRRRPRRPGHQPAGLHRTGALRVGVRAGPPSADPARLRRRGRVHRDPRPARTSSRASTAPSRRSATPGKPVDFTPVATNADVTQGLSIIDAYVQGHPNLAGLLAVDAGSTQSVGQTVAKYKLRDKGLKVAGGFDLVPETLTAVKSGDLDYTIDQQPYLQGFLPVLALYLLQADRRPDLPDPDQHRAAVRHQGQRRPVPEHQDAVRGLGHRGEAGRAHRPDRTLPDRRLRPSLSARAARTDRTTRGTADERRRRPSAASPRPRTASVPRRALDAFLRRREASVLVVAIGLVVYFQASTPLFLTPDNLRNIAQATAPTAIVAVGIVFLLVSGEIDISVGMVAALAPYLMHYAIDFYGVPARSRRSCWRWRSRPVIGLVERADHHPAAGAVVRHHAGHVLPAVRHPADDLTGLPGRDSRGGQGQHPDLARRR